MAYERVWNGTAWVGATDTITPPPGGGGGATTAMTIAARFVIPTPTIGAVAVHATVTPATVAALAVIRTAIIATGGGTSSVTPSAITSRAAVKLPTVTGSAPPTGTVAYLPWNLTTTYAAGSPQVYPHYFTQYPPKYDEAVPDYYDRNWMPPGAIEAGTDHRVYGGLIRDRYPILPVYGGTTQNIKTKAMMWEVREAIKAKMDGFTIDILSSTASNQHWTHIGYLFDAVEAVNAADGTAFKLWFMCDGTAATKLGAGGSLGAQIDASAISMAALIATYRNRSPMLKRSGRMLLGIFGPELWPSGTTLTSTTVGSTATGQAVVTVSAAFAATVLPGRVVTFASGITGSYTVASVNTTTGAITMTSNFTGSTAASGVSVSFAMNTSNSTSANHRHRYWTTLKNELEVTYQQPTDMWACYVNNWTQSTSPACAPVFNDIMIGHARWGDRDPVSCSSTSNTNRGAPAYCHSTYPGKLWMHYAAPGDTRPNDRYTVSGVVRYRTWESEGSLTLHESWMAAIDGGADQMQHTTWNDLSESAHIMPSKYHGYVFCDLATYYIEWFKTKSPPLVRRDGVYLFHPRYNRSTVTPGGGLQTKWGYPTGATALKNMVEVTAFLTDAATVELYLDSSLIATWQGVQGRNRWEAPMPTSGSILSARAARSGVTVPGTHVISDQPLVWSTTWDDYLYRAFSSLRQA